MGLKKKNGDGVEKKSGKETRTKFFLINSELF